MLEVREFKGLWWLPGQEDNQLAGTLTIEKGDARLELIGHFGHEVLSQTAAQTAYSMELAQQPRIVGMSTDGKPITLEGHTAAPQAFSVVLNPRREGHR